MLAVTSKRKRHVTAILYLLEPHVHHMFKATQKIKAITTKGEEGLESMCEQ
jgi:hypothetical protein